MKIGIGAGIMAIALSASVVAAPRTSPGDSAAFKHCLSTGDAARGMTSAMIGCTSDEIDRQGARLNRAYKSAMAHRSPARKAALRASERKWISRRDRTCQAEAAKADGGTLAGLLRASCVLDETEQRTLWLERQGSR